LIRNPIYAKTQRRVGFHRRAFFLLVLVNPVSNTSRAPQAVIPAEAGIPHACKANRTRDLRIPASAGMTAHEIGVSPRFS